MSNSKDEKLNELTELLRKSIVNAEQLAADWGGEYLSPSLRRTVEEAKKVLKELDQDKALQEN